MTEKKTILEKSQSRNRKSKQIITKYRYENHQWTKRINLSWSETNQW